VTPGTATILHFPGRDGRTAQLEGYNIGAVAPDASVAD
jgi:probable phosphoglycerate mutase